MVFFISLKYSFLSTDLRKKHKPNTLVYVVFKEPLSHVKTILPSLETNSMYGKILFFNFVEAVELLYYVTSL